VSKRESTTDRGPRAEDLVPTAVESWRRHMRIRELIEQARRTRRVRAPAVATSREQR